MGQFKPLTLHLIDQGRFLSDVNVALAALQSHLIEHVRKYGTDKCKGEKAELAIKLTLKHEGRTEDDYSVKASMTEKRPGRPSSVNVAIADEEQDGVPLLWVHGAGGRADDPQQKVLTTDDGRVIDQQTGEVKE